MEHLLFLVHRIPYPPNKGDKIRSYHLLKHLAQNYHVHLGTFVDDPDDWQYVDHVKTLCDETHFAKLNPLTAKVCSLSAFVSNRPLSLDYYRNDALQTWVRDIQKKHAIQRVLVFSSAMAQFVEPDCYSRRVIDFVDIDSDKWMQYSERKSWPMNWVYRREGRQLLRYERHIAQQFDASLFVSNAEATLFKQLAPESAEKTGFFSNGVDTDYFSPEHTFENPYAENETAIVFTGAMDYWPNVDAVQWFAQEIFPAVLAANPQAIFAIVGSRPTAQVQVLATQAGIRVTGTVPDVRPYLAHAKVSVAPLRVARGIQNKVLEAMAMGMTVVVSPQALEGIDAETNKELVLAENSAEFIDAIRSVLQQDTTSMKQAARKKVIAQFGWSSNLASVDALLNGTRLNSPENNQALSVAKGLS